MLARSASARTFILAEVAACRFPLAFEVVSCPDSLKVLGIACRTLGHERDLRAPQGPLSSIGWYLLGTQDNTRYWRARKRGEQAIGNSGTDYSVNATVHKGSQVDFLIGPGPVDAYAVGVTEFTATLQTASAR